MMAPDNSATTFPSFSDPENIARLMEMTSRYKPDIVIFDPLVNFYAGESENGSIQMHQCFQTMQAIARAGSP